MKPFNMIAQIKQTLSVPLKDRTPALLNMLVAFTKDIEFFRNLAKENSYQAHVACCCYMKHEMIEAGQVVFSAGDEGDKFYIILQGSVSVLIPLNKTTPVEFEEVNVLRDGHTFGELALLRDEKRMASIVCKEETHFAVLEKQDFKRLIGEVSERRINEVVTFLRSISIFAPWSKKSIIKLSYYFKQRTFNRKQIVYKEGDFAEHVYFVKEGEFQLLKKIITNDKKPYKRSVKATASEIAILGKGEILGEEDVLHDQPRDATCVCFSTSAETYYISKHDFMLRINQDFFKYLQERTDLKRTWRDKKVEIMPIKTAPTSPSAPTRPQPISIKISTPKANLLDCPPSPTKHAFAHTTKLKQTYHFTKKTLPELMLNRLKQDKQKRTRRVKSRFVNIHMQLMRTSDFNWSSRHTLQSLTPVLSEQALTHEGDFFFRSLPSRRDSPLLRRHYSVKAVNPRCK